MLVPGIDFLRKLCEIGYHLEVPPVPLKVTAHVAPLAPADFEAPCSGPEASHNPVASWPRPGTPWPGHELEVLGPEASHNPMAFLPRPGTPWPGQEEVILGHEATSGPVASEASRPSPMAFEATRPGPTAPLARALARLLALLHALLAYISLALSLPSSG